MSRFRFRLEPVLDVRARAEQLKQRELAQAQAALEDARNRHASLVAEHAAVAASVRERHRDFDAVELQNAYARLEFLTREIEHAQSESAVAQGVVDRARARLIVASKDRKVLETLKERRRAAHQQDESQLEQRTLDDDNGRREARFGANS